MIAIEYEGHCSYEESVVGRVDTILGYSIYWDRVKEGQIIIDWAQGNGEGVWAFVCPFPDNLAYAVYSVVPWVGQYCRVGVGRA